jgi:transcriptional regulator with XRE-family HTH domain
MTDKNDGTADSHAVPVATHFARQLKKTRLAHGWTLDELSRQTGINAAHLSRIENGWRPPTEKVALACDTAFPERGGWFTDWYNESRTWSAMSAFRDWREYEDVADRFHIWTPSIIDGLLQTERYAAALLATAVGATPELVQGRLTARLERQQRVLFRAAPPNALFIIDELSLLRQVGTAQDMAEQVRHLADVATLPNVTLQVLPAIAHAASASGMIIAGDAAYVEHLAGGVVLTASTTSPLTQRFDTLRSECRSTRETAAQFEEMFELWTRGASPLTAMRTATHASK